MKNVCVFIWIILLTPQILSGKEKVLSNVDAFSVSVHIPVTPLFKGKLQNALFRIRIYVPEGTPVNVRNLECRLNQAAAGGIEKIEMYDTGAEPLLNTAKDASASVTPASSTLTIPFSIRVTPGIHYLWFSAVLKPGADMDKKMLVEPLALSTEQGKKYALPLVTKGSPLRYVGMALKNRWDDSVHTYRIPGITATDKGTLVAVYDVRYKNSGDLPGNIDVGMSRSTDGGRTWEKMKIIMDMGAPHENNGIGDPSILFDPVTKRLYVAALWSKGNRSIAGSKPGFSPDTTGQFVLVSSDDDGLTWSQPYSITPQIKKEQWHLYFNGPGSGIAMQNGTLVFASQYWDENRLPHSAIVYSEDHGNTWKSGTGAKSNTTESQVVETKPGVLMLNMRDNRGSFRSVSTTRDMGKTWVEHHTSWKSLPDPVCMAGIIKAKVLTKTGFKDVLFFSNVNSSADRINFSIKASLDLGESWLSNNSLLLDERKSYGYSVMAQADKQTIGVLYEGIGDLLFVRVPIGDIIN